jgi:DNA-binding MarR family transcriptional regulator
VVRLARRTGHDLDPSRPHRDCKAKFLADVSGTDEPQQVCLRMKTGRTVCHDESMSRQPRRPAPQEPGVHAIMDSFRRIVHALRSSHRAAGDVNLTGAQLFVLATLATASGPMGVKELAEATGTDRSTVSVVAGRLVERGLVRRLRSTVDTRRVELSLTARGSSLQRKAPATTAQTKLADALSRLPVSDATQLTRILSNIVEMMGESSAPAPMLFDENGPDDSEGMVRRPSGPSRQRSSAAKKSRTRPKRK